MEQESEKQQAERLYVVSLNGKPTVLAYGITALEAASTTIAALVGERGNSVTGHVERDTLDMRVGRDRIGVRAYWQGLFPAPEAAVIAADALIKQPNKEVPA